MSVWVFPAIHNPDGLFIYFCSANLTLHVPVRHKDKMQSWSELRRWGLWAPQSTPDGLGLMNYC
jgi:hypothetical protein